jgi:hypothetical protein
MFRHFFHHSLSTGQIDTGQLQKRFDLAITKKLAIIKLPPSFWMQDPKINPRADHLFWAALLLGDSQRASLAVSALAVEHEEQQKKTSRQKRVGLARTLDNSLHELLQLIAKEDKHLRLQIRRLANQVTP